MTKRERAGGYLVVTVSLLLGVVAMSALWLAQSGASGSAAAGAMLERDQLRYVTEAGLRHVTWQSASATCEASGGVATQPFAGHSYSAGSGGSPVVVDAYDLEADADTWLSESSPTTNYGSDGELRIKAQDDPTAMESRGLIHFDLSAIPPGSQVLEATLSFYVVSWDSAAPVEVHAATAPWDEATATWNDVADAYAPAVEATLPIQYFWGTRALRVTALAQAWVNAPAQNHGLMLIATSDDRESRYKSRETGSSSQRPRLELLVASGAGVAGAITVRGTLASGPERTQTLPAPAATQGVSDALFLPGPAISDTFIGSGSSSNSKNFGGSTYMEVKGDDTRRALIRFDLASLPDGAVLTEAKLGLRLVATGFISGGTFHVHRVTESWKEGHQDGETQTADSGAIWQWRDWDNRWTTDGGAFDPTPVASRTVWQGQDSWIEWNVTSAVEAWRAGEANHGLLVRSDSGALLIDVQFASGDAVDPRTHPYLALRYSCPCGSPCAIPRSDRRLLFVVRNAASLDAEESRALQAFQEWGYTVALADDDDLRSAGAASVTFPHEVVFVSGSTSWTTPPVDLDAVTQGVVFAAPGLLDPMDVATGEVVENTAAIDVTDITHWITRAFPLGDLELGDVALDRALPAGTLAPGLELLATGTSYAAVVALEAGAETTDAAAPAAGHRVYLPLGDVSQPRWSTLTTSGRLLVHRAIEWAATSPADTAPLPVAHWKLDETTGTVAADSAGGHDGTLQNGPVWEAGAPMDGGLAFDGSNDLVSVPDDDALDAFTQMTVMAWIENRSSPMIGTNRILTKAGNNKDDGYWLGLEGDRLFFSIDEDAVEAPYTFSADTRYHVAATFDDDADAVEFFVNGLSVGTFTQNRSLPANNGALRLGDGARNNQHWEGLLDDVRLYDTVLSPEEIDAVYVVGAGVCEAIAGDDFDAGDYAGSSGDVPWASDWLEINEADGPGAGDEQVFNVLGNTYVRVRDNDGGGEGIERHVVDPGASAASLHYKYTVYDLDNAAEWVRVEISSDGGASWQTLHEFAGPRFFATGFNAHDVSDHLGTTDLRIRFITSPDFGSSDQVHFDDVEIRFDVVCR